VNTLIDDNAENSIDFCCLILLKFQLFLLIKILQTFKLEFTLHRVWDQDRKGISNKTIKTFLKILNSHLKIFTGTIF